MKLINRKQYVINTIIFLVYFSFVSVSYIYVYISKGDKISTLILGILSLSIAFFLSQYLFYKVRSISFRSASYDKEKILFVFILTSIITFLFLLLWFAASYPGSYNADSFSQYEQAVTGQYNDWHPYWHTLLFFTLPLKVFSGNVASIVFLQIFYFSLALGYMSAVIYKLGGKGPAFFSIVFILLNPFVDNIVLYALKDVGFAIAGLLSLTIAIDCYFDDSKTIAWYKLLFLGLCLANVTLFRHNGILFSVPLLFALYFILSKKQFSVSIITFFLVLFIIKFPLFNYLHVEKPGNRVVEIVGLPMTIIGNIARESPEIMDDEMKDFIYSVSPEEEWENSYIKGNFNSIKIQKGINSEAIEEAGVVKILGFTLDCFRRAPKTAFEAFVELTDIVYGIENDLKGDLDIFIGINQFGIEYEGNRRLLGFFQVYSDFVDSTILEYLKHIGVSLIIILFVCLSIINVGLKNDLRKLLIVLPIFIYDFGTMFLLSGEDARFFFITFIICPLLVVYCIKLNSGKASISN